MKPISAGSVTFPTTIEQFGNNTGIPIPDDALATLGGGRRPKVIADIDGYEIRASLGSMNGRVMLSFSKAHRDASGFAGGRDVTVTLTLDEAPTEAQVPDDLARAFSASPSARAFFDGLSSSYQRNFVTQIEAAKAPETRARRIASTIEKLAAGQKR